jgi:DNA-binding NtrC family response regulator
MNNKLIRPDENNKLYPDKSRRLEGFPSININLETLKVLLRSLVRQIETLNESAERGEKILNGKIDLEKELKSFEIELIRSALIRSGGKQRQAAKFLNINATTLNSKIKRYGISLSGLELTF